MRARGPPMPAPTMSTEEMDVITAALDEAIM
jgi:hypothetical protein